MLASGLIVLPLSSTGFEDAGEDVTGTEVMTSCPLPSTTSHGAHDRINIEIAGIGVRTITEIIDRRGD